jgi:hypothetical protein
MFRIYVATVCSKCFSRSSLIMQQVVSCCKLQIWMFLCVSHTYYKCVFQMFHLLSDVCCIQMFYMLQVFYVVRLGVSGLGAQCARGPTDGGAAVRARLGHARP